MTVHLEHPLETLKRRAILSILSVMGLSGVLTTTLHRLEANPHLLSFVIPPLTVVISLGLLLYLVRVPQGIDRVIQLLLGWSGFIIIFPEYFFVIEAFLHPDRTLISRLPPISSGLFLLTTSAIVFLHSRGLIRLVFLLWLLVAAPIVVYLITHPQELVTPRGLDLIVTLVPAMGINLCLILFYLRLQDTNRQLAHERFQLQSVAERDTLTGLLNRGAGERILQACMGQADRPVGLILCDVDHFKQVNDIYGHLVGDQVLQAIAQRCQARLRKQDRLIRWGGEEFVISVLGEEEATLGYLAEDLRRLIAEQPIPVVGRVTASFGVAMGQPQETLLQLFARADQALYRAKARGRNQTVLASTGQPPPPRGTLNES
jgi:diguanylate cyclase (GGDEF)-like protein